MGNFSLSSGLGLTGLWRKLRGARGGVSVTFSSAWSSGGEGKNSRGKGKKHQDKDEAFPFFHPFAGGRKGRGQARLLSLLAAGEDDVTKGIKG